MQLIKDQILIHNPTLSKGYPTGFPQFDEVTGGLSKGELVVIAGLRGLGKTALASQLAMEYSKTLTVAYFSMEMPLQQLYTRMEGNIQDCKYKDLVDQKVKVKDETRQQLANLNLYVSDVCGISPMVAKQIILKTGIKFDLIFFDHLGCFRTDGFKGQRYEAIDRMCEFFKTMAKELNCVTVILAHLNREADKRDNHKPRLCDCREGAGLENFGNKVILLYRPAWYKLYEERVDKKDEKQFDDSEAYFILAKNTNGETGEFPIVWKGTTMKFLPCKFSLTEEF